MQDASFSIDLFALLIWALMGCLFLMLWRWGRIFEAPHVKFSDLKSLKLSKQSFKQKYHFLPYRFLFMTFILFSLAFIDPHYYVEKDREKSDVPPVKQVQSPSEGVAIYFVLDQSGSMSQEVKAYSPQGRRITMTKMDLLKQVTRQFIEGNQQLDLSGRPNDMLGLVSFARGAQVLAPLTLDHQAVLEELDDLNYVTEDKLDGTSIGYAIFKTANLIAATKSYSEQIPEDEIPAYQIKSAVMILVTDGFQSPSPLDKGKRLRNIELVEAADYARLNGIRLYVVNVEPRMESEEFATHRKLLKQIAELTGGKFFLVDRTMSLDRIYGEIDSLEKSTLPAQTLYLSHSKHQFPDIYERVSFYPYLIAVGMGCMIIAAFLEAVWMRRIP